MHFYESSIITTKDGLHCQVYGNEHPTRAILIKPKYIPTDKIYSHALQYRFLGGRKMNRLNLWIEKEELQKYFREFQEAYPHYVYQSEIHDKDRFFFAIPIENMERIYFPRRGLKELMTMPEQALDAHLLRVYHFVQFLLQSGLRLKDLGVTYSTLTGHYSSEVSDINIVVYGKENFWKMMNFLQEAKHHLLRWKSDEEWRHFLQRRSRFARFGGDEAVALMKRKKSEGYFDNVLFVIFAAEKEEEVWFKWGEEKYRQEGLVTIQGTVIDHKSSVVRPGCYIINNVTVLKGGQRENIQKVVFYNRDYCMLAFNGEKIEACGVLEEATGQDGNSYYRVVVGYFDAYVSERREQEYIKVVGENKNE